MPASHDYAGIAANVDVKTVDNYRFDSYEACAEFANAHRADHDGYDTDWHIASNMRLRFDQSINTDHFAIVLYNTEIIRYYPDGTFSVDNGGHNTPTTARRITQFIPDGYVAFHKSKLLALYGQGDSVAAPVTHADRFPCKKENH